MSPTPASVLVLALAGAVHAGAAFNSERAGTTSAEFLKLGADARGVAMGSAMSAVADDASAVYWNPAGLAALKESNFMGTHSTLYESVFYDFIAYARPIRSLISPERRELRPVGLGTLAAAMLYLNAGSLDERDNTGVATGGDFTPRDFAFMAGWGGSLTRTLDLGVSFKYIDSRIQETARSAALDAGLRVKLYLAEWPYTLAFSAQNLGPGLKFRERSSPLPMALRAGQSLKAFRYILLSSDFVFPRDNKPYPTFGTELRTPMAYDLSAAFRLGWSARLKDSVLEGRARVSLGGGLSYGGVSADYAWLPFGNLGGSHRLSLSYRFRQ